jgi:hypothetical protein
MANHAPFNYLGLDGKKHISFSNVEDFDMHAELDQETDTEIRFKNCTVMRYGRYFKLSRKGYKFVTESVIFTADRDGFTFEQLIAIDLNTTKKIVLTDLIVDNEENLEIVPDILC